MTEKRVSQKGVEVAEVVEKGMAERVRVVIGRPAGGTDSHLFIGFNGYEAQVAFEEPVELPRVVLENLLQIRDAVYAADDSGAPRVAYVTRYAIQVLG